MTDQTPGKSIMPIKLQKNAMDLPRRTEEKEEPACPLYNGKTEENDKADDDWVAKQDPSSGKTYYYNKKTNETSWVKPEVVQSGSRARTQILERRTTST